MNFTDPEDFRGYFDTLNIIVYLDWDDHDFVDQEDYKDDRWKFCLADIAITHTILKENKYFQTLYQYYIRFIEPN